MEGRDVESTELEQVSLGLPNLEELGAKWMVQMAEYFADNPPDHCEWLHSGRDYQGTE